MFAQKRTAIKPHALDIDDLDAPLITAFLDHLEHDRGKRTSHAQRSSVRDPIATTTPLRHPDHAATIARVLAIPSKRHDRAIVSYLDEQDTAALLGAPDRSGWIGRRDTHY